jgi:alpha-galactosidase
MKNGRLGTMSGVLLAILAGLTMYGPSRCAAAAEQVSLASLNLGLDPSPWNLPRADRSATGRPLMIKGKKYEKGIGARAGSSYFIALGGSQRFTAEVGLDDQNGEREFRRARFVVLGDDKVLFDSGAVQAGQPPKKVDVDVQGVRVLELRSMDLAAGQPPALVDWIAATLTVEGARPKAVVHPEPAVILTPKPGPQPRINGARVFGVRPGSPFLFTIAATGERPMTFAAEKLPPGLAVNPETGVISGRIANAEHQTYPVTLKARNALGEAARELRIVVNPQIALTPPLGWNSWNCYAETVDQQKVMDTAKAMVAKGLKDHGWTYVNIDDTWQGPRGGPFNGIQGNQKFPDIKGLCDQIHAMGLKVGIYSTPWATSYAKFIGGSSNDATGKWSGGHEFGKYSFAANDARQWAAWGIDYLKYDWRPTDIPHVAEMSAALRASGRDIAYSLSNTSLYVHAAEYARLANCWRTTCDIRDLWDGGDRSGQAFPQGLMDILNYNPIWQPFAGPGHYNDPDMLVVGKVGWGKLRDSYLTPNEQYTHVSLWCLWSAPLLIGAPVDQLDDFTLGLLCNDEVLEINQDPWCAQARRIAKEGPIEVWAKPLSDGVAVGVVNVGFEAAPYTLKWSDLPPAIPFPSMRNGSLRVRDLWRQKDLGTFADRWQTTVPRHGVVLIRLSPPGRGTVK